MNNYQFLSISDVSLALSLCLKANNKQSQAESPTPGGGGGGGGGGWWIMTDHLILSVRYCCHMSLSRPYYHSTPPASHL